LIDAANAAGGPDNITVIVARFEGEGLPEYDDAEENDEALVRHRPFPLDDSGAGVPVPIAHNENETTQPIPVTQRPSAQMMGSSSEPARVSAPPAAPVPAAADAADGAGIAKT